jgi:type I restriction enzyme S subunit
MKKYEKYKDSGVEWIGEIPNGWDMNRIGNLTDAITGYAFKSDSFSFESGIKLVRGDNVTEGALRWGEKARYWSEIFPELERFLLQESDIVVGMDGSKVGKNFAMVSKDDLPLLLVQRVTRLRAGNRSLMRFIYYNISTAEFRYYINISKTDPAIPHITLKNILHYKVCVPPHEEQSQIAAYLDHKTAQLDDLIRKKERLIELLKEERTALINQAVTKGLDPSVPMKDSGIEWLGEIPAHWGFPKMKFVTEFILDGTHGTHPRVPEGYRLLSVRNIIKGEFVFRDDDSKVSGDEYDSISSKFKIEKNDIQLAIVGATLGKVAIVKAMDEAFVTQRSLATIRANTSICIPEFLHLFMRSEAFQSYLWLKAGFSAQPGVYLGTLQNSTVPLPDIVEQKELVEIIASNDRKIGLTIATILKEIALLKEYKTALISEVVTGKIDVRDEIIPLPATALK